MLEVLEVVLKDKKNVGITIPQIRYFDGNGMFSGAGGEYKSDTLKGSLKLFLNELLKNEK